MEPSPPHSETQWTAFALRVLEACTLEDKLRPLGPDEPRAGSVVPDRPGRPAALGFHPRPGTAGRGRTPMPTPRSLSSDQDRGRVLHAMANHELMALELFAVALLRFPEIPAPHRRAMVRTMHDEQRHLSLYLDRMRSAGCEVGVEPVSTFFWDALAPVADARRFVAGLSLCLEQANLDFAREWEVAFRRVGDLPTADVLREVYEDEVRHLRIGIGTFRALEPGADREVSFASFASALVPPLSPARARGIGLDREGRARAGFSPAFVDQLAIAGGSRGRIARLFVLQAGTEDELAGRGRPTPPELATLAMWMARREDLVLAPPPRAAFLATLAAAGFPVCAFVGPTDPIPRISGVVPWAASPSLSARFPEWVPPFDARRREVHGKAFAARCLRDFLPATTLGLREDDVGVVCTTVSEVAAAVGEGTFLVKADLSTAGGHRVRLDGPLEQAPESTRRFVDRALLLGPVVVERELPVAAEFSVHATVEADRVRIDGITRFFAHRGVYRGTFLGPVHLGASKALARFLHREGRERGALSAELDRAARFVGERARDLGHLGPLSLDAIVVDGADGLRLKPISEVNPRWTMSRIALGLRDRVAPNTVGWWWFLPAAAVEAAAPAGLAALLQDELPMVLEDGRLAQGVLPTSDPVGARLTTWLFVARRWSTLMSAFDLVSVRAPELAVHLPLGLETHA